MSEQVKPYAHSTQSKKEQVATMFDNIAGTYDFLNHFLSAGIDYWWRYVAINQLKDKKPKQILDVATGTGDFALASLRLQPDKIIGIDISDKMLDVARQKIKNKSLVGKYEVLQADSENLPFADASFDAVTVAFGVRNFENLSKGLQEMHRVLQTNGKVIILEFSVCISNTFYR